MELGIDIKAYVRGVLRRWWLVVAIFVVGAAAAIIVATKLPATYESTARILVESQQIPDDLARSTVTASAAERLQIIQQRLMTRRNLLEIIELLDLFADRDDMSLTE
ncbi:MAG: Wzz/FepE/Etk N-terminal domain-containing protein, partial [Paracoccaceae bacterium]